jgi:hypothetical protein
MSSSPIEYRSFTKILLGGNIPALSASSLQKKSRNKVMWEIQNINEKTMKGRIKQLLDINKHRDKNYLHSVSVQMYRIYNSRLYVWIGRTPFQPATQDNYTENE